VFLSALNNKTCELRIAGVPLKAKPRSNEQKPTIILCFVDRASFYNLVNKATIFLTYLLTPWSRVLLEMLTGFAASQEILRIYGTRKFVTVLTSAHHLSLS
jgi:hypothetical protein